jgi:hypothetical protein
MLKKRGGLITAGNFDKVNEFDKEIDQLINKKKHEFTRPVTCFITFESPVGHEIALEYIELHQSALTSPWGAKILGCDMKMKQAAEPTDIIWENRHFTEEEKRKNKKKVIVNTMGLLFFSLLIITVLKVLNLSVTSKYPASNCDLSFAQNGPEVFQKLAYREYNLFYDATETVDMAGDLNCFCKKEYSTYTQGFFAFYNQKYSEKGDE